MGNKGFFKRVLPFLATFTVGIFIASVVFGLKPGIFRGHRHHRGKMTQEIERLKTENGELRIQNLHLKNELIEHVGDHGDGCGSGDEITLR